MEPELKTGVMFEFGRLVEGEKIFHTARAVSSFKTSEVPYAFVLGLQALACRVEMLIGIERDYQYEEWKKEIIKLLDEYKYSEHFRLMGKNGLENV